MIVTLPLFFYLVAMASTIRKPQRAAEAHRPHKEGIGQVQSLARGLVLLDLLATSEDGLSLSAIAHAADLAPSTAHRLLRTLEQHRFAFNDPVGGLWSVGVASFAVGSAFVRSRNYVTIARGYMRDLVDRADETANLAIEDAGEAVYLAQVESRQIMRTFTRPGARVPLHASGVGKALLAALPEAEARTLVGRTGLSRLTARTAKSVDDLIADLRSSRVRGFAIDDEEHAVGLRCVASAIFDDQSRPIAAISISGPAARIDDARLQDLGTMVRDGCRSITAEVGGCAP